MQCDPNVNMFSDRKGVYSWCDDTVFILPLACSPGPHVS